MKGQSLAVNTPTMSSREIAELVNSNHSDVKRSAERLSAAGILTQPLAEFPFEHRGNTYTEYHFNKRDSLVLVARLSPEFTAAVVDRWQELEQQRIAPPPMTDAERLLITAQALVNLERGQQQMQAQIEQHAQKLEQIATGAIPPGWQTIANLALACGLTPDKTRQFVRNFDVPHKKVPFMAPTGILTNATVADEQAFHAAFAELKRTASRPVRGVMWQHPKLGKFQMREVQA